MPVFQLGVALDNNNDSTNGRENYSTLQSTSTFVVHKEHSCSPKYVHTYQKDEKRNKNILLHLLVLYVVIPCNENAVEICAQKAKHHR